MASVLRSTWDGVTVRVRVRVSLGDGVGVAKHLE